MNGLVARARGIMMSVCTRKEKGVSNPFGTQGSVLPVAFGQVEGSSSESSLCYGGSRGGLGLAVSPIKSL